VDAAHHPRADPRQHPLQRHRPGAPKHLAIAARPAPAPPRAHWGGGALALPDRSGNEYHLTAAGKDLEGVVEALGRWAVEWLFDELKPDEIDPVTLMWWMHRRIDAENLPPGRVVIQFDHTAPKRQTIWIVLDRGEASVCVQHPGFDADLLVTTTTPALAEVFDGHDTWTHAVSSEAIRVEGPPGLVKALPRLFLWSPFADVTRARAARAARSS
jgi:hypothetical protein